MLDFNRRNGGIIRESLGMEETNGHSSICGQRDRIVSGCSRGNGQALIPEESQFIAEVIELEWYVTDVIDLFQPVANLRRFRVFRRDDEILIHLQLCPLLVCTQEFSICVHPL